MRWQRRADNALIVGEVRMIVERMVALKRAMIVTMPSWDTVLYRSLQFK